MMHAYQNVFLFARPQIKFSTHEKWDTCRIVCWAICIAMIAFGQACVPEKPPPPSPLPALEKLHPNNFPHFTDDMPLGTLLHAIKNSLQYLNRVPASRQYEFGNETFSATHMIGSLQLFSELIENAPSSEALNASIREAFWIYRSIGRDNQGEILFTGYYEPNLQGSLHPSSQYSYPLYKKPHDWVTIELSLFGDRFSDKRLVGRIEGREILPYFSREEIDTKAVLEKKGLELLWVKDPVDLFFLHVQGSGRIALQTGDVLFVNYDCNNGRPYRSIGQLLIDEGKVSREDMSLQKIRSYLRAQPEDMKRVFNYNESYVFFRIVENGPLGALEVPLTPGRSIATDLSIFPQGAIAFVVTEKPDFNSDGEVVSWNPFSRFMMNQDTGGAIRGPGRVDIFWGNGSYAESAAGHMKQNGSLFFLIKKR